MNEKRAHPRETAMVRAIRCLATLPNGKTCKGSVEDISPTGARVVGDASGLAAGDDVKLAILFPLDRRVVYRCKVKYVGDAEKTWGVEFTDIATDIAQAVRA